MAISLPLPKVLIVWFKDLERWDCSFFRKITWSWPKEFVVPLGKVLTRKQIQVCESNDITILPIIEKITFGGIVSITDKEKRKNYKGRLFWAERGDLIYSKIRVKQGSFVVIPHEIDRLAVSTEYPVYSIKQNACDPVYLSLVLRSKAFLGLLEGLSHGGSTKTRIPPSVFEGLEIPLPPLPVQQVIVERWQKAQDEIAANRDNTEYIQKHLEKCLLNEIGIELPEIIQRKGAFRLDWQDLERWDTFFYREDFIHLEKQLSSMPHDSLGKILNFISRSWKTADFPDGVFKYVEISSVSKNAGISGTKPVNVNSSPSRATTLIKQGDFLISTTRPYLGAFAIVPEMYDNCVCSSGFALADKIKQPGIDKDFLLFFLKSSAGLRQMERRMTGGLYPAIVQAELEKIIVPIPPLEIQRKIMLKVRDGQYKITNEREAAERKSTEIKAEIEALILGTKKMEAQQ